MKYLLFIGGLMLHLIAFAQSNQPPLELSKNLEIFKTVRKLFDLENPKSAPVFESFRTTAKREDL